MNQLQPYRVLNFVFAAAILIVFAYTCFFAGTEYALPCRNINAGQPCVSCGLTRSFAFILSGEINNALKLHPGSLWIFGFFAAQLALRPLAIYALSKKYFGQNNLIAADAVLSAFLFLLCFAKGYGWV